MSTQTRLQLTKYIGICIYIYYQSYIYGSTHHIPYIAHAWRNFSRWQSCDNILDIFNCQPQQQQQQAFSTALTTATATTSATTSATLTVTTTTTTCMTTTMRNNLLALHARTAKTFHMLNFGLSLFVYPVAKAAV